MQFVITHRKERKGEKKYAYLPWWGHPREPLLGMHSWSPATVSFFGQVLQSFSSSPSLWLWIVAIAFPETPWLGWVQMAVVNPAVLQWLLCRCPPPPTLYIPPPPPPPLVETPVFQGCKLSSLWTIRTLPIGLLFCLQHFELLPGHIFLNGSFSEKNIHWAGSIYTRSHS